MPPGLTGAPEGANVCGGHVTPWSASAKPENCRWEQANGQGWSFETEILFREEESPALQPGEKSIRCRWAPVTRCRRIGRTPVDGRRWTDGCGHARRRIRRIEVNGATSRPSTRWGGLFCWSSCPICRGAESRSALNGDRRHSEGTGSLSVSISSRPARFISRPKPPFRSGSVSEGSPLGPTRRTVQPAQRRPPNAPADRACPFTRCR